MTQEEMIAIIKANQEGKPIQHRRVTPFNVGEWTDICYQNIYFNFAENEYRIKPGNSYRPYADAKEFYEAAKAHGGWVKGLNDEYVQILAIWENNVGLHSDIVPFGRVYDDYVWADDNSPCGVLED